MSDLNPYAPPATMDRYREERLGRRVVGLVIDGEFLRRAVGRFFRRGDAEAVGCAAGLVVFFTTLVVAFSIDRRELILAGYLAAGAAGFATQGYWLRRRTTSFLKEMHERTGVTGGAPSEVQLTRTGFTLRVADKRRTWRLIEVALLPKVSFRGEPRLELLVIFEKRELILPIPWTATFHDSSPEEFVELFRQRHIACQQRRERIRWRRFWRALWHSRPA